MLHHPATDFYDLAAANAAVLSQRQTPPYCPTGLSVVGSLHNNNNNNSTSNNNNLDLLTHNSSSGLMIGSGSSSGGSSSHLGHSNGTGSNGSSSGVGVAVGVGGSAGNGGREALPSFGFTQEQVACVCEVSYRELSWI